MGCISQRISIRLQLRYCVFLVHYSKLLIFLLFRYFAVIVHAAVINLCDVLRASYTFILVYLRLRITRSPLESPHQSPILFTCTHILYIVWVSNKTNFSLQLYSLMNILASKFFKVQNIHFDLNIVLNAILKARHCRNIPPAGFYGTMP